MTNLVRESRFRADLGDRLEVQPPPSYTLKSFNNKEETLLHEFSDLERVAGIEPATLAWKARALPLCNTRGHSGQGGI